MADRVVPWDENASLTWDKVTGTSGRRVKIRAPRRAQPDIQGLADAFFKAYLRSRLKP